MATNPPKRKHKTLSMSEKVEILKRIDSGESANKLAVEYGIGRATINGLKRKKESIISCHENSPVERKTLRRGAYPLVDATVYSWYLQQKVQNIQISSQLLQRKAKFFYSKLCPEEGEFKASEGWLHNFRKRFGIGYLSIEGEKTINVNATLPYQKLFLKKIEELNLTPDQIYNATESGIFWRLLPENTFITSESASDNKVVKEQVTFMVCANAAGSHKIKLLLVGKSEASKTFENCALPVRYVREKRGWIDRELFKNWFDKDFVPSVRQHLVEKNLPKRALLILDNAPGHPDELISDDGSITAMFLPPKSMPLIQSMEQNVIQAVKMRYWKNLLVHILSQSEEPQMALKKLNMNDVYLFFVDSWDLVGPNLIRSSWKGLWEKNSTIPKSDFAEKEEMDVIVGLLNKVSDSKKITEEQIKSWVIGKEGSKLTDDEIVETALKDNEKEEHRKQDDPDLPCHTNAINHFNSCIQWATQNNLPHSDISVLLRLRRDVVGMVINKVNSDKE